MRIIFQIVIITTFLNISKSQAQELVLKNKTYKTSEVENAEKIVYYGLDFSLIQWIKMYEVFEDDSKYLKGLINSYHREIPPQQYIQKWLNKPDNSILFNLMSVQQRADSVSKNWIVSSYTETSIEAIKKIINHYDLKENDGIGLVIHPVLFNDIENYAICFFTFFRIDTREIFWISEVRREADEQGHGHNKTGSYNEIYTMALVRCTKTFIDKVYKPEFKR